METDRTTTGGGPSREQARTEQRSETASGVSTAEAHQQPPKTDNLTRMEEKLDRLATGLEQFTRTMSTMLMSELGKEIKGARASQTAPVAECKEASPVVQTVKDVPLATKNFIAEKAHNTGERVKGFFGFFPRKGREYVEGIHDRANVERSKRCEPPAPKPGNK